MYAPFRWFGVGLVFLCVAAVRAQDSPLDVAASLAESHALSGDWKNVILSTRGLVRVIIDGDKVHPFGACQPTACDWGEHRAQIFASKVDAKDSFALLANVDTGFDRTVITISLQDDGRLRVQTFTHFTDASRRADYSVTEYFVRQ